MAAASTGRQRYRWLLLLVAAAMLVVWLVGGGQGDPEPAGTGTDATSGLPVVRLADLPPEAERTVELIEAGGPFT